MMQVVCPVAQTRTKLNTGFAYGVIRPPTVFWTDWPLWNLLNVSHEPDGLCKESPATIPQHLHGKSTHVVTTTLIAKFRIHQGDLCKGSSRTPSIPISLIHNPVSLRKMKVKYTSEDNVDQMICHVLKKKKHKKVFYSSILQQMSLENKPHWFSLLQDNSNKWSYYRCWIVHNFVKNAQGCLVEMWC